MVGGDRRRGDGQPVGQLGLGVGVAGQRSEAQPDPLAELSGGLAGEGQPEDRFRVDQAVGHQPADPGGHRLRLARARTGDDDQRPVGGRRDDPRLLVRRRIGQPAAPGAPAAMVSRP